MNNVQYLVILLPGLHPHVVSLVPCVLDGLRSVSPAQGLRGKLACGQVGRTLSLCLQEQTQNVHPPEHLICTGVTTSDINICRL